METSTRNLCNVCDCDEQGVMATALRFRGERLSRCIVRNLPAWAMELAEWVILFRQTNHLPIAGGMQDQPAVFVAAMRRLGWADSYDGA